MQPHSVDAYIAACPSDVQPLLKKIRAAIREAVPDARETISYRMPTFVLNGVVLHFGAFKQHIGLFPPVSGDSALMKKVSRYAGEKGNLRFPLDEPVPFGLIAEIARQRAIQNAERAATRKATRSKRRKG